MLPTRRHNHDPPTVEVKGDFPVHYIYTVGISGEKFFQGLKDKKLVANNCSSCNRVYLPPKLFCEECFDELGDDTYAELAQSAELFSFSQVYVDFRGNPLETPYTLGLFKVDGSTTTFFHKLINVDQPSIGMKVTPVWNDNRTASIFDLKGFTG